MNDNTVWTVFQVNTVINNQVYGSLQNLRSVKKIKLFLNPRLGRVPWVPAERLR